MFYYLVLGFIRGRKLPLKLYVEPGFLAKISKKWELRMTRQFIYAWDSGWKFKKADFCKKTEPWANIPCRFGG